MNYEDDFQKARNNWLKGLITDEEYSEAIDTFICEHQIWSHTG